MYKWIFRKLFGTDNDRTLKRIQPFVAAVNAFEPRLQPLSNDQLKAKTAEFKEKLAQGASLDDILPEAFAVVREASRRTTRMRHFDVQIVGGVVLHQGKIAEMKTGEGKTLVATLPAYLNALSGKGVHIVTVNDYLAKRDTEWMGAIYRFLGLSVGTIQHGLSDAERYTRLPGRHHLRHEQRVRLRLPPRQHEIPPGRPGPARVQLRHRRRGRQHPHRRGPDAAHHLRADQRVDPALHPRRQSRPPLPEGQALHPRREEPDRLHPGRRRRRGRARPRRRQPLRPGQHGPRPRHQHLAQGPPPFQARRRLHGPGRQGRHRRRVHRAAHARPPLQRRAPPGPGSQGAGQGRGGIPDPGLGHLPELLPHVQEAGRDDRHGGHRGDRVPPHLRPRRRRDPDEQAPHPPGEPGRHLPDRPRRSGTPSSRRSPSSARRADPSSSAPSRSRNRSTSARSSAARTSSTSSSTPSTTNRRPRSSPRPAASGR